jgi:hypothetical protein
MRTKLNIGFILLGLFSLISCDMNDTKKEEMILTGDTSKQIVLRTKGKNINALDLLIKGEINGSGQMSIGDNDSVFYKTYDVKDGQTEIKYNGDWYSKFCYVTFRSTTKTNGRLKLEADFAGD